MNIGKAIIDIRWEKRLQQKELATLAEINQATLSQVENGKQKPTQETLEKIAKGLGVNVSDIHLKAESLDQKEGK